MALWLGARELLWALTRREVQARYAGSWGGIGWAYAQPLLTVAAYYLVFDVVFAMRLGAHAPSQHVGTFLIVGALPWMAFSDALARGGNSLVEAGGLLQKNALPLHLFPARTVLASALVFLPLLLLLALAYWPLHQGRWPVWLLPLWWILQILMALGAAVATAVVVAAVRDMAQVVAFGLQMGIFLSPALFPYQQFPEGWRWVLWANPMTPFLLAYQDMLLLGQLPAWPVWCGAVAWTVLLLGVATLLYVRARDQLVDWL